MPLWVSAGAMPLGRRRDRLAAAAGWLWPVATVHWHAVAAALDGCEGPNVAGGLFGPGGQCYLNAAQQGVWRVILCEHGPGGGPALFDTAREVIVQAGTFGEHEFAATQWGARHGLA